MTLFFHVFHVLIMNSRHRLSLFFVFFQRDKYMDPTYGPNFWSIIDHYSLLDPSSNKLLVVCIDDDILIY
jgi:hypothetical protein